MAIRIIGITGQVGSGKSTVAQIMKEQFGAHLIITDLTAHDLMKKGEMCYQLIVNYFGDKILDVAREIDRSKLGQIVFKDSLKLETLNSIVHPYVMNQVFDEIRKIKKENKDGIVIIETAILIESGYKEICDEVWYVAVLDGLRQERLSVDRNYTKDKIDSILKNQLSDEEFRLHSTRVINNNGSLEDIIDQIHLLLVK